MSYLPHFTRHSWAVGLLSIVEVVRGRCGIGYGRCGLWPISSVAYMVVADMVCGRYRRNSYGRIRNPQQTYVKRAIH